MKHIFTLSLVTVIALAFWGMQAYEKTRDAKVDEEIEPHFIDLYMNAFSLTAMDAEGVPGYTLQASRLEHYNDTSSSFIANPVIHLLKTDKLWVIRAQSGEINEQQNRIVLRNNVVMTQQDIDNPIQLNTSLLEIDTTRQIARTDQTVTIVQQAFKLQSNGMILDNTTGKLELLASVEGSYVPSN